MEKMFIDCEKSLFITEILRIYTIDSSKEINKSTKAAAEWEYDVYYFLGSLSPKYSDETICCDVDYLVNVK